MRVLPRPMRDSWQVWRSLVPRRSRGGGNPLGYEAINSDADVADQVNAWIKFKRAWMLE